MQKQQQEAFDDEEEEKQIEREFVPIDDCLPKRSYSQHRLRHRTPRSDFGMSLSTEQLLLRSCCTDAKNGIRL